MISDSSNIYSTNWNWLFDDTIYISEDNSIRTAEGSIDISSTIQSDKYILLKANLFRDAQANIYPGYAYCSLPKNFSC